MEERSGSRGRALVVFVLALVAAACGSNSDSTATGSTASKGAVTSTSVAATDFVVQAGMNDPKDPTIVVNEFLPEKISVKPGTTVHWSWKGDTEPHSVTFNPDRKAPPPGPPSDGLFAPTPGDVNAAGALVNSGLVPTGPGPEPTFVQTFKTAGSFQYFCVIHPGMIGTVEVSDTATDTPALLASRGKKEADGLLAEGKAAKDKLVAAPPKGEKAADGSTKWTVEMGVTTEHVDVEAFAPTPVAAKAGDTVKFLNNSQAPHTATFAGTQQLPRDPTGPDTDAPKPGPSPQTLNSTDLFNSGLLPPNAPPGAVPEPARSFEFKIPAAGQYPFVCILHLSSNMRGNVTVT